MEAISRRTIAARLEHAFRRLRLLACSIVGGSTVMLPFKMELAASEAPAGGFGLIACWPFDTDYSSSVNDAYYRGEARGGSRVSIDRTLGAARIGAGALRIASGRRTAEPGYVAVENPLWGEDGTGVVCVSAWFKSEDLNRDGMDATNLIVESFPTLSSLGLGVRETSGTRRATFRFRTSDYRVYSEAPTTPASTPHTLKPQHTTVFPNAKPRVTPGEWQHVALVWNAPEGVVRFYVGGEQERQIVIPKGTRLEVARGLHIGTNRIANGSNWDGWIDDVAVFDVELSARQIRALAERSFEGREVTAGNVLGLVADATTPKVTVTGRRFVPPAIPAPEQSSQGPLIGHVSEHEAVLWARVPHPGSFTLSARSNEGHVVSAVAQAVAARDWTLRWELPGLQPATTYAVTFQTPPDSPHRLAPLELRVPPAAAQPGRVTLGFGSCSDYPDSTVWSRIAAECHDGMVLLGDTPYIDTTELRWSRWAYRRFASTPRFAAAFRQIPFWGTWDDHDFGRNDSDGTLSGKEYSRQAFVEYRPNLHAGDAGQGVYTRFRRGPVEVFLLDTRWFSKTGPSWADPRRPTLLGARQWEWLRDGLRASNATFKLLASGMIWDGKGDSTEGDAWGAYPHERSALFRWLGENRISGVVLVGGDIHISRHMKYPTSGDVGYDLHQFIISPLNDRVLPGFDLPDPTVVASVAEPWVFLKITADSSEPDSRLRAEWINRDGRRIMQHEMKASELRPAPGAER